MKHLDKYVRSTYFVDGNIGKVEISSKQLVKSVVNLPVFLVWLCWKGQK